MEYPLETPNVGLGNNLTPAQNERLAKASEECGEVVQVIGKIMQHGFEAWDPTKKTKITNREHLAKELADIRVIEKILVDHGDVSLAEIEFAAQVKYDTIWRWFHFNKRPDNKHPPF